MVEGTRQGEVEEDKRDRDVRWLIMVAWQPESMT